MAYKVLECDGVNSPSLHAYKDAEHFVAWVKKAFDDPEYLPEMLESWEISGSFLDPNGGSWFEWSEPYTYDHTEE